MKNFWKKLPKPFFMLAPMDDVTDTVFRQMICKTARPDVFFTEFTNVDALASKGREKVLPRLKFDNVEHPIVAQVWGLVPENFYKAARDIKEMGFDGIDINMGCPIAKVVKRGACSALINNHEMAKKIIISVKKGANGLPLSVKTRLGIDKILTSEWIGFLLKLDLDAITIHARTVKEMSKVPPHWDEIAKALQLRNKLKVKTLIIGNGDVKDKKEGLQKARDYGADGIMIGTGIFKNVYAFDQDPNSYSLNHQLNLLLSHAKLFEKTWGKSKNFAQLRKFFKSYIYNFERANSLRIKLMGANSYKDVKDAVEKFNPDV